ncbi:bifunctional adenosylcobinamide kinase/adenosylcobinamide-phosphate guanylyltransferase [Faecalibacterium sp. AM43-5AT]|jgi:adenosylcobinamide kinase/adenosylcobinamide-phosphate guanylyltransferase|uniref:bifunctional adenosylcobinamide kinase/adenosylcobinamide-phosphate guanylyltransferase n=1 Tax=unclassified Faecalibacterium TaxID=2646395 RepID=UPI000E76D31A|nr:bifunctional adenosylcobinamide kinase/adenosylcobinamide-phosphate guanylyltransferase [Faecalibacterium sp. AM43-5AT]RJV96187.1 cobinamide kinase [Faecalibacterium sp. AM43-5AT]
MIFITGPLYSGKRTFAQTLPGKRLSDVQVLAADAADREALERLADRLASEYDILIATEVGGGVVPMDVKQRADREAAGRLACLLAARAECVVQMFCGIPTVLKGELSQC